MPGIVRKFSISYSIRFQMRTSSCASRNWKYASSTWPQNPTNHTLKRSWECGSSASRPPSTVAVWSSAARPSLSASNRLAPECAVTRFWVASTRLDAVFWRTCTARYPSVARTAMPPINSPIAPSSEMSMDSLLRRNSRRLDTGPGFRIGRRSPPFSWGGSR